MTVTNPTYTNLQLNHYQTKSSQEYNERISKGQASGNPPRVMPDFPQISPRKHSKWELDLSATASINATKKLLAQFREIKEHPHRLGYLDVNRSFAYKGKGCPFVHSYLNKSYANHLLGAPIVMTKTDFEFYDPSKPGKILNGELTGWHKDVFKYSAEGIENAGPFLGSVHLSDFLRRTSGQVNGWWSGKDHAPGKITSVLPRYSALVVLVAVEGAEDGFAFKHRLEESAEERIISLASNQVWSIYKYGFYTKDNEFLIEIEGRFRYCEVLMVVLP